MRPWSVCAQTVKVKPMIVKKRFMKDK